jgi:NAD(P)-dependent dehydrogenase (short-subunit alcohol dehydrogenase family)
MALLDGRAALVTGAGSGIGEAIALAFAREGAQLFLADISAERLEKIMQSVRASGVEAAGCTVDVAKDASVRAMVAAAEQRFGRINVVCNNAGILDRLMPVHDTTDEMWERVIGVNLTGAFYVCRAVLPGMLERGSGNIINTHSISSFLGGRGGAAYTVSKHGILGLTRAIAATYGERGIRCNGIAPGSVQTNISTGDDWHEMGRALREKGLATRPPRAVPDEIAPVAVFLASDMSHYINGANIVADAGWTAY